MAKETTKAAPGPNRQQILAEIDAMSVEQAQEVLPGLTARIAASLRSAPGLNWGTMGFTLASDDPFAAAALRLYCTAAKIAQASLPAVLPYKDAASVPALQSYIVRASGAGDEARVKAAEAALAKCTKK